MFNFVRAVGTAIVATCCLPAPATAGRPDPELSPSLRYEIRGVVPVTCQLTSVAANRSVEFTHAVDAMSNTARQDSVQVPFAVSCNTPMSVQMEAVQGALTNLAVSSDQVFTSTVPYTAKLNLPGQDSALSCSGKAMMPGLGGCIRNISDQVTEGLAAISVTLNPDNRLLLQGTYADRITITLSPILGSSGSGG